MEQLNEKDLKEWAVSYMETYKNDILRTHKELPEIPEKLHSEIDEITRNLKQAHKQGKDQGTFRDINGKQIILNLKPLFETKGHLDEVTQNIRFVNEKQTDTIDDLTLQTYVCRLFLYSTGG
jgi:dsDNA-specific endonuclease/ATPase MutS2